MKRLIMPQLTFRQRRLVLGVIGAIALLLCLLQSPSIAQSIGSDARISRLESENSSLRSRISRLESQVDRVSRAAGVAPTASLAAPQATPNTRTTALAEDPTFQRLATLVIELGDRIEALETAQTTVPR